MAQITLDKLAHSYLANPKSDADFALKQIDYVWEDGGAYALLGPSGCGKTTLLNIISGLLIPSSGHVRFDTTDVTELSPEARNIAQVFQFPVIYDTMTVEENLAFPLVNRGVDKSEIGKRVKDMLETLELSDKAKRRAQGLTADEKQKISLGRGLVRYDVNAILFDEPLTVIDPHMKWQLRTKLKELHEQFNHTMIYVTHDQTEALTFADKVVVMYEGEVVQIGTPEELFDEPAHTFVGYFIGSPGMNIMPGQVQGNSVRVADHSFTLNREYPALSGVTEIGIRPEFIRIVDRANAGADGITMQVNAVENIGRHQIVRGLVNGVTIDAVVEEGVAIPTDAYAVFDTNRMNVYQDSHLVRAKI
ncbi:ABC transporter ATP-binding protein [Granulosicoccus antarcticus]|uniref:Trehalose import ATP-binding protein SugC n=1 Tax=Granulosicoccus antarcticus IMCC3135 TaxID=1192854 RepID=A0A2Z2NKN5_9GAMM|nr:ABC transporter ATP-binding protein [Granulosicoccus antarcticus]ASJ70571.1 Trehalose import ATP-binding protein SugC [Granulosicoccus antarcticus IMCC3135]